MVFREYWLSPHPPSQSAHPQLLPQDLLSGESTTTKSKYLRSEVQFKISLSSPVGRRKRKNGRVCRYDCKLIPNQNWGFSILCIRIQFNKWKNVKAIWQSSI